MLSRRAGGPLLLQVPGPDEDRPQWKRVAVIAAVGFAVGIAWPRLAGVRMGPSLPEVSSSAAPGPTSVVQPPPAVSQAPPLPAAASMATGAPLVSAQHAASSPGPSPSARSIEGMALVVWEVAIIRDAPKTGKVVARLQRGSTLRVGAVKDGWYPVRYGEDFSGDGWVYRGAIGR
jgi:hypothetical protein